MNFREQISDMFDAHPKAAYHVKRHGWVEAWRISQNIPPKSRAIENFRVTQAFKNFIADRLIETDPTQKKIYFNTLTRWVRYGMSFGELAEAKILLERYDADTKAGINHQLERFAKPSLVYRKGKQINRPMKQNFLREIKGVNELKRYFARYDRRQAFRADCEYIRRRDAQFLASGGVAILHSSPSLRVYQLVHSDAERAFAKGADFQPPYEDEDLKGVLQIERSDGSRYRIEFPHRAYNEDLLPISLGRMLRDIPELVPVVSAAYVAYQKSDSWVGGQGSFIAVASRICARNTFPDGYVREYFSDTYQRIIANIDNAPEIYPGSLRMGNPLLFNLSQDLLSLSRFRSDREKISGQFVKQLIELAIGTGTADEAYRSLPVIFSVPHWRQDIHAPDILPVLEAFRATPDILADLLCLVAKVLDWRDGEEAVHLPQAIVHLVSTKNWAKLKTILVTASRIDNDVSAIWRGVISQQERGYIRQHETDNEYKRHHIDILLNRLDALDKGHYQPYRLAATPIGRLGREIAKANEDRVRALRHAKRLVAA